MSKKQIKEALAAGKYVINREVVSEATYLLDCFESEWSRLIRSDLVVGRESLYRATISCFKVKIDKKEIKEKDVRTWLVAVLSLDNEKANPSNLQKGDRR